MRASEPVPCTRIALKWSMKAISRYISRPECRLSILSPLDVPKPTWKTQGWTEIMGFNLVRSFNDLCHTVRVPDTRFLWEWRTRVLHRYILGIWSRLVLLRSLDVRNRGEKHKDESNLSNSLSISKFVFNSRYGGFLHHHRTVNW